MAIYFIDFEAFQYGRGGEYKIKELCILDAGRPYNYLYYLFRQDMTWSAISPEEQRNYNYQTRCIHRLHWEEGHSVFCRECIMRHIIFYIIINDATAKDKMVHGNRIRYISSGKALKFLFQGKYKQVEKVMENAITKFINTAKLNVKCKW